ncbi:ORFA hypothetical protein [Psittacine adenovirus 2]|nr:ORFA hypothetical protein [Psittacine adenovirus 2]
MSSEKRPRGKLKTNQITRFEIPSLSLTKEFFRFGGGASF